MAWLQHLEGVLVAVLQRYGHDLFSEMMMSSLLLAFGDRELLESTVDLIRYIFVLEIEHIV